MNNTPRSNRLHIAVFGRRNSGKSSLVNALTGQDTALVSATPGTTTDPVTKAMEVYPLGPCLFIDTPGFDDDEGELGGMRVERTLKTVEKADIALLLYEADGTLEQQWLKLLAAREIPVILILNKADSRQDTASVVLRIEKECGQAPVVVSAKEGTGIQGIFDAILEKLPENFGEQTITGDLVREGDVVLRLVDVEVDVDGIHLMTSFTSVLAVVSVVSHPCCRNGDSCRQRDLSVCKTVTRVLSYQKIIGDTTLLL